MHSSLGEIACRVARMQIPCSTKPEPILSWEYRLLWFYEGKKHLQTCDLQLHSFQQHPPRYRRNHTQDRQRWGHCVCKVFTFYNWQLKKLEETGVGQGELLSQDVMIWNALSEVTQKANWRINARNRKTKCCQSWRQGHGSGINYTALSKRDRRRDAPNKLHVHCMSW